MTCKFRILGSRGMRVQSNVLCGCFWRYQGLSVVLRAVHRWLCTRDNSISRSCSNSSSKSSTAVSIHHGTLRGYHTERTHAPESKHTLDNHDKNNSTLNNKTPSLCHPHNTTQHITNTQQDTKTTTRPSTNTTHSHLSGRRLSSSRRRCANHRPTLRCLHCKHPHPHPSGAVRTA